jgi:dolichol-phosphate mannosyltransferase
MSFQKKKKILIVIPAFNEEDSIKEVVNLALHHGDVCVIDDCSTDNTRKILHEINGIKIIEHNSNTHIAQSIMEGFYFANTFDYKYVISMDAGMSFDPKELPNFINYKHCDLLIGRREKVFNKPIRRILLTKIGNFIYNIALNFPFSIFNFKRYNDLTSGYRRFSNKFVLTILKKKINTKSFDFLLEEVWCAYKNNLTIQEIPISFRYTNSSVNLKVIIECIIYSLKIMFKLEKK